MLKRLIKTNSLIAAFERTYRTLLPEHKKRLPKVLSWVFMVAVADAIGLATALPVVKIAITPATIETNSFIHGIYLFFGFSSHKNFILCLFIFLLTAFITKNLFTLWIQYRQSDFSNQVAFDLAEDVWHRYYHQDVNYFNDSNSVNLVRNLTTMPMEFTINILMPLLQVLSEFVVIIILVSAIAFYNPYTFILLLLTLVPGVILLVRGLKNTLIRNNHSRNSVYMELNVRVSDSLRGFIDVALLNKKSFFHQKIHQQHLKLKRHNARIAVLGIAPAKGTEIFALLGILIILTYSLIINPFQDNLNVIMAYVLAAYRLIPSLNKIIITVNSVKSFSYVYDVLNEHPKPEKPETPEEGATKLQFAQDLSFQNISFRYPDDKKWILKDFSLSIKKGDNVGIIGPSGSGKTTLINILLRFLQQNEGQILLDGVAITPHNQQAWRNMIGYVKQNVFLFDTTFAGNIAVGCNPEDIDQKRLHSAIRLARLEEVLSHMPNGLNTMLGEGGAKLSGGQRQRIAIARALYHEAQILVFDEATSALDSETERDITDAIESLSGENRTMIIVAHRITTLKNCNIIYELREGTIYNTFSYAQLVDSKLKL